MGVVISVGNGFAKSGIRTNLLARRGHITERVKLRHLGRRQAPQSGQPPQTAQGDGSSSESQAPGDGNDAGLLPQRVVGAEDAAVQAGALLTAGRPADAEAMASGCAAPECRLVVARALFAQGRLNEAA